MEWSAQQVQEWLEESFDNHKRNAADAAGISRPTLDKLLAEGASQVYTLAMMMAARLAELDAKIVALGIECAEGAFEAASEDDQKEIAGWYSPMGGDLDALRHLVEEYDFEEYTDEQLDLLAETITERMNELSG